MVREAHDGPGRAARQGQKVAARRLIPIEKFCPQIVSEVQALQTLRRGHLAAARVCITSSGDVKRGRAMSDSFRYRRPSVTSMCIVFISAGLAAMRTVAGDVPCMDHADCKAGEFCGISTTDSHEGWTYQASFCKPCSQCECHIDSSTAVCPGDRLMRPFL